MQSSQNHLHYVHSIFCKKNNLMVYYFRICFRKWLSPYCSRVWLSWICVCVHEICALYLFTISEYWDCRWSSIHNEIIHSLFLISPGLLNHMKLIIWIVNWTSKIKSLLLSFWKRLHVLMWSKKSNSRMWKKLKTHKILIYICQSKIALKTETYIFYMKNICLGAAWDASGYNNLKLVTAKLQ